MDQRLNLRTKGGSGIGRMGGTHLVVVAQRIGVFWVRLIISFIGNKHTIPTIE